MSSYHTVTILIIVATILIIVVTILIIVATILIIVVTILVILNIKIMAFCDCIIFNIDFKKIYMNDLKLYQCSKDFSFAEKFDVST